MNRTLPALLLAGLLLAPVGSALSITLNPDQAPIAYDAPTALAVTVNVDCTSDFLPGGPSRDVPITIASPPEWLTVTAGTVSFSGADCLTGATTTLSKGGSITVEPTAAAPGMTPTTVTLDADGATSTGDIQVAYKMGYEFTTDTTFPLEVPEEGTSFNATIRLFGNARSMAMFNEEKSDCVSLTGMPPGFFTVQDDQIAGDMEVTQVLTIVVTPSCAEWESASHEITTWSHFLDDGAMKTDDMMLNWTFVPASHGEHEGDEGSPGVGSLLLVSTVLAVAFILRRRE